MDLVVTMLAALLALAVVALAIVATKRSGDRERLASQEVEIAAGRALAETARNEATQRLADKTAAETRLADLQRELAVMRQQLGDFERLKEESLKSNQAAVFETAQQVSSKLLEDHKRESAEAGK